MVATAQTDADGYFERTSLRPGAYRVRIALPEHTLFALGTALELPPPRTRQEGQTSEINLSMGEHVVLDEITAVKTATVSGRAVAGYQRGRRAERRRTALSGVTVTLLDEKGGVVAQQANRRRRPVQLQPHPKRRICVALHPARRRTVCRPERRVGGSCVEPAEGGTATTGLMMLEAGQTEQHERRRDRGVRNWRHRLADGSETACRITAKRTLQGVDLTLLHADTMIEAARTTSDEYGYYHFRNLRPGSYSAARGDGRGRHADLPIRARRWAKLTATLTPKRG